MELLRQHLEKARSRYSLSAAGAATIFWSPFLILGLFLFFISWPTTQEFMYLMTYPSYPIEWGMFFAFLISGIMGVRLGFRLKAAGERRVIWAFYLIFALGLLWTAGEVNAWGQKIFNYETPHWFAERNAQDIVTLHNLYGWQGHNHWLRTAFALGGFAGIWLYRMPQYRKIAVPPILFSWFLCVAIKCALDFWTKSFPEDSPLDWLTFQWIINRTSKMVKLMIGIAAILYLWLKQRELALSRSANDAAVAEATNV